MADDITLTVRVRDMTRGEFNRIGANLRRMQQNMQGVNRTTATGGRNARMFSQDLSRLSAQLTRVAHTGRLTRREIVGMTRDMDIMGRTLRRAFMRREIGFSQFRNAARDLNILRARLRLLSGDGNIVTRLGDRFLLLGNRIRHSADQAGNLRRRLAGMGGGLVGGLGRGIGAMGLMLAMMMRLGRAINMNKRWTAILIATVALLGPAAAVLGAALVAVLGGAFIALGALALKGNADIKQSFQDMKTTVGEVARTAALPMKQHLVAGMRQVGDAARAMQPQLTAAFAATGPLIKNMFGGLTDFVGSALPGLTAALQQSGAAMEGFRSAMSLIGEGVGEMFSAMTANGGSEALRDTWLTLGAELKNLLVGIGEFINMATQSGTATLLMVGVFRALSGVLNLVEFGLKGVDKLLGGLPGTVADSVTEIGKLGESMGDVDTAKFSSGFVNATKPLGQLRKELSAVDKEIAEINKKSSLIKGPAKDYMESDKGNSLGSLKEKREALLGAISAAEQNAAAELQAAGGTREHAAAVGDLITKLRELNELNRTSLDAKSAQEEAFDTASEKAGKFAGALKFVNGQLDLSGESGRGAYEQLSNFARTTNDLTSKMQEQKAPFTAINAEYATSRERLIALATGMFGSKEAATQLADQLLNVPTSVTTNYELRRADAIAGLDAVKSAIAKTPGSKSVTVKALTAEAISMLRFLGFTVEKLPDGQFKVTAQTANAQANIAAVQAARDRLSDRTITITTQRINTTTHIVNTVTGESRPLRKRVPGHYADGGINVKSFADGGTENHVAEIAQPTLRMWAEPETGGEAYIPLAKAKRERSTAILGQVAEKFGYRLESFAKGGMSKEMKEARSSLLGSTKINPLWLMAGAKISSFKKSLGRADSVGDLISAISDWRTKIKAATSGNTEKRLINQMNKMAGPLIKQQIALTRVNIALDKAKTALTELKDKAAQLKENVTNSIIGSGDVTTGVEAGKVTSSSAILNRLKSTNTKATEFARMLAALKSRGLSGQSISEIAQAGLDGGGFETAKALMRGNSSTIAQINQMQKSIADAAKAAGQTTADAMYGAGIKAAEGVVAGLEKQQKRINDIMLNAAKALERAIKKALGGKASGGPIGAATGGPRSRLTWVGEHGPELVSLPSGSMVKSNADSRRLSASWGGGGGQPIEIVVQLDGKVVARQLFDPFRAEIWHRSGGNVQKALGRGLATT